MVNVEDLHNLSKSARDLCWVWLKGQSASRHESRSGFSMKTADWLRNYFKSHTFGQNCIECDCIYIWFIVHFRVHSTELGCSQIWGWFDSAQFQSCSRIVPVCVSLQYSIGEHAHYSLINIPEVWRTYRHIYIYTCIYIYIYIHVYIQSRDLSPYAWLVASR